MTEDYRDPTEYNPYPAEDVREADEQAAMPTQEELLVTRIEERRRRRRRKQIRNKRLLVIGIIIALALMITMCGREIIRLKAENYALKKQQEELREERDKLTEELKHVGNKEYIKDQARKQLRLLDPGEIMFIFDEEKK